jgi:hypothetical protein
MHWVARQKKLETPKEKDEVNKREVHECDVRTHDPDAMVVPPTPKSTFKAEVLARDPPTIDSSCEENAALKKWRSPRLCCASCNPEAKAKVSSPPAKAQALQRPRPVP